MQYNFHAKIISHSLRGSEFIAMDKRNMTMEIILEKKATKLLKEYDGNFQNLMQNSYRF